MGAIVSAPDFLGGESKTSKLMFLLDFKDEPVLFFNTETSPEPESLLTTMLPQPSGLEEFLDYGQAPVG